MNYYYSPSNVPEPGIAKEGLSSTESLLKKLAGIAEGTIYNCKV
jgi:hypothetical protein